MIENSLENQLHQPPPLDGTVTDLQSLPRLKVAVVVIILCTILGSSYVLYAGHREQQAIAEQAMPPEQVTSLDAILAGGEKDANRVVSPLAMQTAAPIAEEAVNVPPATGSLGHAGDLVVFINRFAGEAYGQLAVVNLAQPEKRALIDLQCARVHMAGGMGICLQSAEGSPGSDGLIILFDEHFQETRRYYLLGSPSRTRVSPDGTLAAYTIFVTGHSYTGGVGTFSTDTRIVDMQRDYRIALEDFKAFRHGEPFRHIDFNYWGVTFADDPNHFYATLGTQGKTYIVAGDVQAQTIQVLTEGGECPSLSPDNRTLVFKERHGGTLTALQWRLVAYDLTTGERTPLGETRSVDDQVMWLDNDTIIYALPGSGSMTQPTTQLWTLDLDPDSQPQLFLDNAESPATVRQAATARQAISAGKDLW